MNETPKSPTEFDKLALLVKASFPDIRCLRCNHDEFYLSDKVVHLSDFVVAIDNPDMPPDEPRGYPVVSLVCTNCGHLEHHLKAVLASAIKPITREDNG